MKSFPAVLALIVTAFLLVSPVAARPQIGDFAPDFSLPALDGSTTTMSELFARGPVILAFFRSDCSHCRVELPLLQKLADKSWFKSIQVLAVNVKEPLETVQQMWQELDLRLPCVLDERMKIARSYGVPSIPRLFVVDQGGVLLHGSGAMEEEELKGWFQKLIGKKDAFLALPAVNQPSGQSVMRAVVRAGYRPQVWELGTRGLPTLDELEPFFGKVALRVVPSAVQGMALAECELWWDFCMEGGNFFLSGDDAASTCGLDMMGETLGWELVSDDAGSFAFEGVAGEHPFTALRGQLAETTEEGGPVTAELLIPWDQQAVGILRYSATEAGRPQGFGGILNKT